MRMIIIMITGTITTGITIITTMVMATIMTITTTTMIMALARPGWSTAAPIRRASRSRA